MLRLALGLFILFFSIGSQAKDLCAVYKNYTPQPDWYNEVCNGSGGRGSGGGVKLGGAYSSYGDSFNLNPSSIPTANIPLGVEYIQSVQGSGFKNSFAFIKGFGHFGTALTTNSNETFYGNSVFKDSAQMTLNSYGYPVFSDSTTTNNKFQLPTVNLGSALALDNMLKNGYLNLPFAFLPTIGVTLKYNKDKGSFTPGYGMGAQIWRFSFGVSHMEDPETATSSKVLYDTITVGFKTSFLQLEAVLINSRSSPQWVLMNNTNGISTYTLDTREVRPATILTAATNIYGLLLTVAGRSYQDYAGMNHSQYHFGAQYQISPKIALEYLDNYVIDHRSLGVQVLF